MMQENTHFYDEDTAQKRRDEYVKNFMIGVSENLLAEQDDMGAQITEERRKRDVLNGQLMEMQKKAEHDKLTGLLNRDGFISVVKGAQEKGQGGTILFLDIDNFKKINDTYGHAGGDMVLETVAEAIKKQCRESDAVARYGGEEIVVFFPNSTPEEIYEIFKLKDGDENGKERAVVNVPVQFIRNGERISIMVTFSGGITALSAEGELNDALTDADKALYFSKANKKDQLHIYNDSMKEIQVRQNERD